MTTTFQMGGCGVDTGVRMLAGVHGFRVLCCTKPRNDGGSSHHHAFPIRFAFSGSYHQIAGAPEEYFGLVCGRSYMSQ